MTKYLILVFGLLALFGLGACASLTQNQCQGGDWYGIGVRDGAQGRSLSYFSQNVKACSKYGITPQQEPWRKGREEGLKIYCTPENAYKIGRRGQHPAPVCTAAQAANMSLPNEIGRRYYYIGQRIERIRNDIRDIDRQLAEIGDTDPTLTSHLFLDRARLRLDIQRLELRQLKYATWP